MLELFKNAAKIKALYDEGEYLKAFVLLAKTLAAVAGEFTEGDDGVMAVKGARKPRAADAKNLEKAEATLTEIRATRPAAGAGPSGGPGLTLFLQLLPLLIDLVRRLRERQG